jgi:hypothetical protein
MLAFVSANPCFQPLGQFFIGKIGPLQFGLRGAGQPVPPIAFPSWRTPFPLRFSKHRERFGGMAAYRQINLPPVSIAWADGTS